MNIKKSSKLKILFFGLGSIGKKHAKIIKENFNFELYAYRTGRGQEKNDLKIDEYRSLNDAFLINPYVAFITNPTYLHVETALNCAKRNINLFMEKPISHSLENINELENEIKKRKLFTYVAYNMRFHPVIENLKELISEKEKPVHFNVTCSSYLPNWRPKQDYSKSYSAKKELGGGVILDLSHEIDYISWLFGEIKKIEGHFDKISNLRIDSEDILDAQLKCGPNIEGKIHLDYFTRDPERKIQIHYENQRLEGDLINNTIKIVNRSGKEKITKYKCSSNETYKKQLDYFFEQYFDKNFDIMNNFSEASKTFKKIIGFKKGNCWL